MGVNTHVIGAPPAAPPADAAPVAEPTKARRATKTDDAPRVEEG